MPRPKWNSDLTLAPRDGSLILLLPKDSDLPHVGWWNKSGTSWVDKDGGFRGKAYQLKKTGSWYSGGGWFQPNEVRAWMPLGSNQEWMSSLKT